MTYHADSCRYLAAELITPAETCRECGIPLTMTISRTLGYCDDDICDCGYWDD
jgi:hypothetical protein